MYASPQTVNFVNQYIVMEPGNLCSNLMHKFKGNILLIYSKNMSTLWTCPGNVSMNCDFIDTFC